MNGETIGYYPGESRVAGIQTLEEADKTLPAYMGEGIKIDRKEIEEGAN